MAQIKVLKLASDGIPLESVQADDVTFNSFSVSGGAQVLDNTGLVLGDTPITQLGDVEFSDPSTATINFTAGAGVIDDLMLKERSNTMTTAGEILFPVISDTAGQVDNFRVPSVAGIPTATPTNGGEGFMVWDSSGNDLYIWNGSSWDSQSTVEDANRVTNPYTAEEALLIAQALYISSADSVSLASATSTTKSKMVGFSKAAAATATTVDVVSEGVMSGFTGLTPGAVYYLDDAPGAISTSVPTGTGKTIVSTGISKNATTLHVSIQQLGRRS